jgi:hypothetical protein
MEFRIIFLKTISFQIKNSRLVPRTDLAEGDGKETTGTRSRAAAAEYPRREGAAVDKPLSRLQLVEVLGNVHGCRRRRLELLAVAPPCSRSSWLAVRPRFSLDTALCILYVRKITRRNQESIKLTR